MPSSGPGSGDGAGHGGADRGGGGRGHGVDLVSQAGPVIPADLAALAFRAALASQEDPAFQEDRECLEVRTARLVLDGLAIV